MELDQTGLPIRFISKVRIAPNGCWEWTSGCLFGYGRFKLGRRYVQAHRFAYEAVVGLVPDGMEPDHLCRNTKCVNPTHLEMVAHVENVRRGVLGQVTRERMVGKTHCPAGHSYDAANTHVRPNGHRVCRACGAEKARARRRGHYVPKDCCLRGHPLTPDNTYVTPRGWRRCRICLREGYRRRYRGSCECS